MISRWACVLVAVTSLAVGCGDDRSEGEVTDLSEDGATTSSVAGGTGTTRAKAGSEEGCEVQGGVSTEGTDLMITLTEWKIAPATASADPGIVSFVAENAGQESHELVIVKGESAEALPTDADGGMDEAKLAEDALVGEIEPFAAGQLCRGNFAMTAGDYVLACNVVEEGPDGTRESHFAEGMHTTFKVGS